MTKADLSPHALMLRDTVVELLHLLEGIGDTNEFDRGYKHGLGYALDVLKMECAAFGLPDDLGLPPLDFYR